jgi:hypothetical protein
MARTANSMITFADALDMVNQEGYTAKQAITASQKCMTRAEIEQYLEVDNSLFTSYSTTRLVPYDLIQKVMQELAWRGINEVCEQGEWYYLCMTASNQIEWAFDRFRLYYPTDSTEIGVFSPDQSNLNSGESLGGGILLTGAPLHKLPFSSTNGFEHDFTFDLSFNDENGILFIGIRSIPYDAEFQQIYTYPTGYGSTRGIDSNLMMWDFSTVNTGVNVGGADTSIIMNYQPSGNCCFGLIYWGNYNKRPQFNAKTLWFDNNNMTSSDQDAALYLAAAGGITNGNLKLNNNDGIPNNRSNLTLQLLEERNWTYTGSAPQVRSYIVTSGLIAYYSTNYEISYGGNTTIYWYDLMGYPRFIIEEDPNVLDMDDTNGLQITSTNCVLKMDGNDFQSITNGTIVIWIKTTDTQGLFFSEGTGGGNYLGAYHSGNKGYNSNAGSVTIYVDGVQTNLYDNIRDGAWHMVEFKGVNLSGWSDFQFNRYSGFQFDTSTYVGTMSIYNRVLTQAESTTNFNEMQI